MKKYCFICFLAVAFAGCQESPKDIQWSEIPISGEKMKPDSPRVGFYPLLTSADLLFCSQSGQEKNILVYQIKDDSLLFHTEFIRKGDGPHDMNIPVLKSSPDSLYAIGLYNGENKIFRLNLNALDSLADENKWQYTHWRKNFSIRDIHPIGNGLFLANGSDQDSNDMLFLFNPKEESFVPLGIPFPDDKPVKNRYKSLIYSGKVEKQPGKDRFVFYVKNYGRYAILFDYQNDTIKTVAKLFDIFPEYRFEGDSPNWKLEKNCLAGIKQIIPTENYLYVTYPVLTIPEIRESVKNQSEAWHYKNDIYVFDWDGNPVKKYKTDMPIKIFTVSPDDKYLYASGEPEENEDITLRFKL